MMVRIFQSVAIALSATINGRKLLVQKYYPGNQIFGYFSHRLAFAALGHVIQL